MGRHQHNQKEEPPHDPAMRGAKSHKTTDVVSSDVKSSVQYGVSLFGAKTKTTVDCLVNFILTRNVKSIRDLLHGKFTSYPVPIGDGVKRRLDAYGEISNIPVLLALQLQNDSLIDSTTEHTTADVVAILLDNFEKLEKYLDQTGLQHANRDEVINFARGLGNVTPESVSIFMLKPGGSAAPSA